jgi:SAM-dependent methyltransferase
LRKTRSRRHTPHRLRDLLTYHATLLADAARNRAFYRALRAKVKPGMSVLDLGAGTGLWSVVAARLGARRVVAVEREPLLVPVIERLARENGVADRVTAIRGDANRLRLSRRFDVVVSETVGNEAFEEGIVPLLTRARRHFLKKEGALVPWAVSLKAAPVRPFVLGVRPPLVHDRTLSDLLLHVPQLFPPVRVETLSPGKPLLRVDLRTALPSLRLEGLRARFRLDDGRALGGFVLWAVIDLAPGVRLSTRATTSWWRPFLPAEPAGPGPCVVDLEVSKGKGGTRWRVAVTRRGTVESRDYSSLFAYGAVRSREARSRGPRKRAAVDSPKSRR